MTLALEPIPDRVALASAQACQCPEPRAGRRGHGLVEIRRVDHQSRVVRSVSHEPLKLLAPQSNSSAASIYATTFGGGLVAGDQIQLDLTAGEGTTTFLTTQSATKVYRSATGQPCRQSLHATLASESLLIAWPDPICCFAGAVYEQHQRVELAPDASLVLLDWQTSGRRARGERWAFARYHSRNQICIDEQCVLNDALLLDATDGPIDAPFKAGRFECLATLILIGPALANDADTMLQQVNALALERRATTLCSASRFAAGTIVRILGRDPQHVAHLMRTLLVPITARLTEDPWSRKW